MSNLTTTPIHGLTLPNRVYDVMKWIVMILLPALSALYVGIATIWSLPYANEITMVLGFVISFLGSIMQLSAVQYSKNVVMGTTALPLSANFYDTMRWVVAVFLPALAAFYQALGGILKFLPYPEAISSTIMVLVVFLGALLQQANFVYRAAMKLRAATYMAKDAPARGK